MGMIKDYLRRQEIDAKAQSLVHEHFTDLTMKKISASNSPNKKPPRKLDTTSRQLKKHAADYIRKNKLGVYGKSKFLKVLQENLFDRGLNEIVVKKIIKSLALTR